MAIKKVTHSLVYENASGKVCSVRVKLCWGEFYEIKKKHSLLLAALPRNTLDPTLPDQGWIWEKAFDNLIMVKLLKHFPPFITIIEI